MKKLLRSCLIVAILFSCNEGTSTNSNMNSEDTTNSTAGNSSANEISAGCYGFHQNGDAINFNIISVRDSVQGDLEYALAEKDRNSGKFSGIVHGDKLIGTYRFSSEGMISTREMAFMIKDNSLIEGFGDVNQTSSGAMFKDTASLKYDVAMPLVKDSCR